MFVVISKSNHNNELFSSMKTIKGTVINTVRAYMKECDNAAIVTNWDVYYKMSETFKKKHKIIIYSENSDWCEDVWQCNDPDSFRKWYMSLFGSVIVLGGSTFIKQFKNDMERVLYETITFDHIITVISSVDKKGWPILKTGNYQKVENKLNEKVNMFNYYKDI